MRKKGKLELTWVGKYDEKVIEPRILVEDKDKSYGEPNTGNMLIHGDNLIALKALQQDYAGKIKCIYIDPPYNTGAAFEHYDDGIEHSIWLSMMKPRMEMLSTLLAENGSIWISIDDNECHYFKVMMDEILGRRNFIATIIWQKIYTVKNSARHFSDMHDYILVYAKDANVWERNLLPRSKELNASYSNPDNDNRGVWTTNAIQARNYYSQGTYEIVSPSGQVFTPPKGTYWRISKETFMELDKDNRVWWGKDGTSVPRIKKFLSEAKQGVVPATFWAHTECGQNAEAKTELRKVLDGSLEDELFITPKPERLIKRILEIATNPGDYVLDSFLGSGTTAAAAHKMGRKWIGVELGDHAYTHCKIRMDKVVGGEQGGISKAVDWYGGGGYKFYELAESLLVKNSLLPVYQINPTYTFKMLCEAICKIEGFEYRPAGQFDGRSSENHFIHITKEFVNGEYLNSLMDELGEDQSLLVYGVKIQSNLRLPGNVEVKKIPKDLLEKCTFESEVR